MCHHVIWAMEMTNPRETLKQEALFPPKQACTGVCCEPGSVLDARVGIEQNTEIPALVEFTFDWVGQGVTFLLIPAYTIRNKKEIS